MGLATGTSFAILVIEPAVYHHISVVQAGQHLRAERAV